MMKLLMLMLSYFIINKMNKLLIQFFYQLLMYLSIMMLMIIYPLNNLNFSVKIYYIWGIDFYSMGLILLSFWILSLVIMSLMNMINLNNLYTNILIFLIIFLIMCFVSMNIMMFFMFFESSLIPIFLIILGWGLQVDRIQAGIYMMLYTLFGSMPLLLMIFNIYNFYYSMMFNYIEVIWFNWYMYIMIILGFLIKMPMYLVHLWLPKAHVEAPLVGSMILAGVMLKLGSYGLMRFMLLMLSVSENYNKFYLILSIMGGVYSSLVSLMQVDMKMLVAYSSVVHMSILLGGLMTMFKISYLGTMLMMISHGLCSSGLFYLVNISYERYGSRSLMISKGMINLFPSLSLMWFCFCSSSVSLPPSLNLFSEIMLFNSLIMWSGKMCILLFMLMLISVSYTLYLYSYSQHGFMNMNFSMKNITIKEYMVLIFHWVPMNLLFLIMIYFY